MKGQSLWEHVMEFCPCCGKKLDFPQEPATCRKCGWEERPTKSKETEAE